LRASMPSSINSTSIRLSLKRRLCAKRSTCRARGAGRDTLRRTCLAVMMAPLYTNLVHRICGTPRNANT
jgi:hypothetical protein